MSATQLVLDIRSYWHPGSGRGAGAVVDASVHRDASGLPALPGRHLKGLLREATSYAEQWEWPRFAGLTARLFGDAAAAGEAGTPAPGCLRIGDAVLSPAVADYLGHSEAGRKLVPGLFRELHVTAIDPTSGAAQDKTLRAMEVVVPLELHAPITPIPGKEPPAGWQDRLAEVLPLIRAVGAQRSRGLGRACLSLESTGLESTA